MPRYRTRRAVLRAGAAGLPLASAAGCLSSDAPAAGSLVFDNRRNVPHVVTLRVTSGPGRVDDPLYEGGTSAALKRGERRTVPSVLTESGTYEVEGWLLSQHPETTKWEPETATVELRPEEGYAEYLRAVVRDAGLLELRVVAVA